MQFFWSKKGAAITIILLVVMAVVFFVVKGLSRPIIQSVEVSVPIAEKKIIGTSVENRKIESYTFGNGGKMVAFVGGIHGGYEWNSVLLAYQAIDYLTAHPEIIPKNLTVVIIPEANPDGVFKVTGKEGKFNLADVNDNLPNGTGRFNANGIDLNRNFACHWQATSTWKGKVVSAGTSAFSEPEAQTIQNFVIKNNPVAMIFWHSQSNAVYASQCGQGILPLTKEIMNIYARAAGYPAVDVFDSYAITGAVEDWLATINIPAITVELSTHKTVEWDKNLAGMKALFVYLAK